MNRLAIFLSLIALQSSIAHADDTTATAPLDPAQLVSPVSVVQGSGVKVGEGTSIYPQVGLETGFISNVFYDANNPIGAGILRLIVEAGAGSLSEARRKASDEAAEAGREFNQGDFQYTANAYATWDQYLSNRDTVNAQGGLGGGLYLRGLWNPGRPFSFLAFDDFNRVIRATNFESRIDTNRDVNRLSLGFSYTPAGRSIGGSLTYTNVLDLFEDQNFQFSNRFQNTLAFRLNWKFFPLSNAYAEVSEGLFTGLGSMSTKATSYPLNAFVGINTALTLNTSVIARIGYANGFYSSGPSYSSLVAGAYIEHKYSPLGKVRLMYSYDHADSINANFYRDHMFQGWLEQKFDPFGVYVSPILRLREYEGVPAPLMGPPVRDDLIFEGWAGVRYQFRDWIAASLQYRLVIDETSYRYTGNPDDPSYVRHEVTVGIRAAY